VRRSNGAAAIAPTRVSDGVTMQHAKAELTPLAVRATNGCRATP
jgi:hypothetical protein